MVAHSFLLHSKHVTGKRPASEFLNRIMANACFSVWDVFFLKVQDEFIFSDVYVLKENFIYTGYLITRYTLELNPVFSFSKCGVLRRNYTVSKAFQKMYMQVSVHIYTHTHI